MGAPGVVRVYVTLKVVVVGHAHRPVRICGERLAVSIAVMNQETFRRVDAHREAVRAGQRLITANDGSTSVVLHVVASQPQFFALRS